MRWALIENSKVANVVEQDDMPFIEGVWVACGNAGPGWGYADDVFAPPESAIPPAPNAETRLSKRAFWNRFPQANETAMRAIMAQGSPALLAGMFATLQSRVDSSEWVDVSIMQTIEGVGQIASEVVPTSVEIEGQTLPLRLTAEQAARILELPSPEEAYQP